MLTISMEGNWLCSIVTVLFTQFITASLHYRRLSLYEMCRQNSTTIQVLGEEDTSSVTMFLQRQVPEMDIDCSVTIGTSLGRHITVVFSQLLLRQTDHCIDYIKISSVDSLIPSTAKLCGSTAGNTVIAKEVTFMLHLNGSCGDRESIALTLTATSYRIAQTCNVWTEVVCRHYDITTKLCMWRGHNCDGVVNCPYLKTEEDLQVCDSTGRDGQIDTVVNHYSRMSGINVTITPRLVLCGVAVAFAAISIVILITHYCNGCRCMTCITRPVLSSPTPPLWPDSPPSYSETVLHGESQLEPPSYSSLFSLSQEGIESQTSTFPSRLTDTVTVYSEECYNCHIKPRPKEEVLQTESK